MKVRVLYKTDGSIYVVYPDPKSKNKDESKSKWLKRVFDLSTPDNVEYEDMDDSELPDGDLQEFWVGKKGKKITIDKKKMNQKLYKDKIQKEKERLLEQQAIGNLKASGELPSDY